MLQQLVKHVELDIPLAAACTAQVLKAVAGLLKHTWEDFKVLDVLKLLFDPMGVLLEHTEHSPPPIGEHQVQLHNYRSLISTFRWLMKCGFYNNLPDGYMSFGNTKHRTQATSIKQSIVTCVVQVKHCRAAGSKCSMCW